MTNNELLTASLLDILFEGRNKEYGAYALRRGYNRRLVIALALGLVLLFLLFFFSSVMKGGNAITQRNESGTVIIQPIEMAPDATKKPDPVLPKPKKMQPAPQVATIQNTTIRLVDERLIDHTEVPENADLTAKISGLKSSDGQPFGEVVALSNTGDAGGGEVEKPAAEQPLLPSSGPEFPGGTEALQKFLYRHLQPPVDLEAGDKKIVRVRFTVDKDGQVSRVDIETSGGDLFDREVIRVCKKMPKWKPAIQKGLPVTTSYVLPVTFISEDR